jgi:hypothetical protein
VLLPFSYGYFLLTFRTLLSTCSCRFFLLFCSSLIVLFDFHFWIQSGTDNFHLLSLCGLHLWYGHLNELLVFFYLSHNVLLFLLTSDFLLLFTQLAIFDHLHLLVIVQVDFSDNHEIVPVNLLIELLLLIQDLSLRLVWVGCFFQAFFLLVLIPKVAISSGTQDFCGVLCIALKLGQLIIPGDEHF